MQHEVSKALRREWFQNVNGQLYSSELEAQILDLLENSKFSFIEGIIRTGDLESALKASLMVTGQNYSKKLRIDETGSFHLQVLPGAYKINIPKNMRVALESPDGLNSDPYSSEIFPISLVAGQCVQFKLEKMPERTNNNQGK
jgi:hypothetical protein